MCAEVWHFEGLKCQLQQVSCNLLWNSLFVTDYGLLLEFFFPLSNSSEKLWLWPST